MSAIFGFTFHIGRMTEVHTPDIYREFTGDEPSAILDKFLASLTLVLMTSDVRLKLLLSY